MGDSVEYLTYTRYKQLGGTLDRMSFNLLEYKSRKQIDLYTYNRLTKGVPEEIEDSIEYLMMNLISINNTSISSSSNNKASESIDGYSVQYRSSQEMELQAKNEIIGMLSGLEVDGVPLTYAGGVNDNKQFYYPIS